MTSSFWEYLWVIVYTFLLLTYLIVLFQIIADLFRDHSMNGFAKAIWVIFLFILPMLTALVYLIFRGGGMGARQAAAARQMRAETDAYIRETAGVLSPAEQIARAKTLLQEGTITEAEFATLKSKALA